jgi:hypothetical protein
MVKKNKGMWAVVLMACVALAAIGLATTPTGYKATGIRVEEASGTPTMADVQQFVFPDGTVTKTDASLGVVTLSFGVTTNYVFIPSTTNTLVISNGTVRAIL